MNTVANDFEDAQDETHHEDTHHEGAQEVSEQEADEDFKTMTKTPSSKNSLFAVEWLQNSFVLCEGAHIARELLFDQYCQHCSVQHRQQMNSASFGKIIRTVFPTISTRRLGTRGNSKYHYYGIRPTNVTMEYKQRLSTKPMTVQGKIKSSSSSASKKKPTPLYRAPPSSETLEQLLHLSPADYGKYPMGANMEHIQEFFGLYRDHCYEVLSDGLQGHFEQFGESIVGFWKTLPEYLGQVLEFRETCRAVAEWDAILFQSMLTIFLPDILSQGDKAMLRELRNFTKQLPDVLNAAFREGHAMMLVEKARVAHDFNKIVKQYYHLNQLALNADHVSTQNDVLQGMLQIWNDLDFASISTQAIYICANANHALRHVQEQVNLKLEQKHGVMKWAEWIFSMTEQFVNGDSQSYEEYTFFAQQFIIGWHYIASLIMRDIGEKDTEHFVSFHYIRLFCDEYVKYLIDCKLDEKRRQVDHQPPPMNLNHSWSSAPILPHHDYGHPGQNHEELFRQFQAEQQKHAQQKSSSIENFMTDDYAATSKIGGMVSASGHQGLTSSMMEDDDGALFGGQTVVGSRR